MRAGTLFEAIGLAVAVTYLAALRFTPVELLAVADGFGKLSPVLLLLPAVPLAIGHLLGAFGRAVTLDACRDVGAGPPATVALVLACCRVVLAAVALLSFAALLLSVAFGAGANDRAAQAAEDAHFTRGVAALTFAYLVGLLIEATVLPALATVAAVRKWHEVGRRATGATLALQLFVIASLVAVALTLLPESEPVRAPRGRFEPKPVPLAEALAFAVQAVALGWYLAQQYALSAAGCRVSNGRVKRAA